MGADGDAKKGSGGDSGAGEAGNPSGAPPAGGTGGGSGTAGLPVDVLPEQLRGRPAAEVKVILQSAFSSLGKANQQMEEMRRQLAEMKNTQPQPQPDPKKDKPLEELILEDPESAILSVLERKGLANRFDGVEKQTGSLTLQVVGSQLDDFGEVKDDVVSILEATKVPMTEDNIRGAYTMVMGRRAIEERQNARLAAMNPEKANGGGGEQKKEISLSPIESEILTGLQRSGINLTPERYKELSNFPDIKVPGEK